MTPLGSSGTMTCPVLPYFCLLCVRKDGTRAPEGPYWARKCRKGKCAGWERVRFIAGLRVPLCCPFPSPVHTVLRCVPGERGLAFPGCLAHADTGSSSKVSAPSCCPPPPAAAYSWGCRSSGLLRKWGLPETSCRGEASVCAEVTCASFPFCEGTAASSRNGDLLAFVQSLLFHGGRAPSICPQPKLSSQVQPVSNHLRLPCLGCGLLATTGDPVPHSFTGMQNPGAWALLGSGGREALCGGHSTGRLPVKAPQTRTEGSTGAQGAGREARAEVTTEQAARSGGVSAWSLPGSMLAHTCQARGI
jgi:hypothetical protein